MEIDICREYGQVRQSSYTQSGQVSVFWDTETSTIYLFLFACVNLFLGVFRFSSRVPCPAPSPLCFHWMWVARLRTPPQRQDIATPAQPCAHHTHIETHTGTHAQTYTKLDRATPDHIAKRQSSPHQSDHPDHFDQPDHSGHFE